MEEIKSKISLHLLTTLSSIIKPFSSKINLSTDRDIVLLIRDKNPNYDFFFKIEKEEITKDNNLAVVFTCKPYSTLENFPKGTSLILGNFRQHLLTWFENIEKYKTENLIDDPVEKQFQEEFYDDLKIVDADSAKTTFNFSQQILLTNYIENVKKYISEETTELSPNDKEILIKEIEFLKKDIAVETKDSYIKKQSSFWAKVRKKSIKVCEFVVKEFGKEVIKEMVKKGITYGWETLPYYIEHSKLLS